MGVVFYVVGVYEYMGCLDVMLYGGVLQVVQLVEVVLFGGQCGGFLVECWIEGGVDVVEMDVWLFGQVVGGVLVCVWVFFVVQVVYYQGLQMLCCVNQGLVSCVGLQYDMGFGLQCYG